MVSFKRQVYGLPFMRWYRLRRARQIANQPRVTREGFSFASYDMAFSDDWERAERAVVAEKLPECGALIDVGANNGFYSLLANHLGKPALAIEPDAGNLIVLRQNVSGTAVEVCPCAVSDTKGTVTLYGDGDMASFDTKWQGVGAHFKQSVPAETLDGLLEGKWPADRLFIKVDVEGAEALVLAGASQTLRRSPKPYWLIETLPNIPTGGDNAAYAKTLSIMARAGYQAEPVSESCILFH